MRKLLIFAVGFVALLAVASTQIEAKDSNEVKTEMLLLMDDGSVISVTSDGVVAPYKLHGETCIETVDYGETCETDCLCLIRPPKP